MTPIRVETSVTVFPIGPICSSEFAYAISPNRETLPYVGFRPTIPQNAAGQRIDPPVSVPSAIRTMPAAIAAALPPEEPPGTRPVSHGLSVGPNADFSVVVPIPNSSMFVLPTIAAPDCLTQLDHMGIIGRNLPFEDL